MKQLKDLWIKIPFLKEFTGLEFSEYVLQLEKLADWQKRRVIGKNRNPDGVFPAVLNSIKNKEQFLLFKQKIHPFIEKEFQTYMGLNNVCFYIVDQDLFNKIMQPQTDFVQNFRGVPLPKGQGQQEKKANMSKPKNQENLCNVPKENWREVMKTNQNLPTKPVIVLDANEQEKVFNELKNKRFIYRWVKKNNTNEAYVGSSETKERRRPFFHLKRAGKSHSLGTNKILQRNIRKYGRDLFVLVIFETFNPLCEQTTKKEFRDFVLQKEDFYLNFFPEFYNLLPITPSHHKRLLFTVARLQKMKRITQTRKVSKEQRQKQREKTEGARNPISKAVFIEHIWDPSIFLCFETLKQLKDFFGYKSMSKITSVVKNQRQGGNVIKKYWKVITYPTKYAKELLHNNNL